LCGGSGSFLLRNAIASGADIFITGDIKYHDFFEADSKIIVADIGHYESEQFTKELLMSFINKNNTTFAVQISEVNTNPISYFC
jgi:putative NIF3 family GTP cyclohydrolase 1 type 2